MNEQKVIEKLQALHREYQDTGGFKDASKVSPDARPLADLEGFDSHFIPEIVRRTARELGHPLPKGTRVKNIYVEKGRKLSIREIARKFLEKYAPKEAKNVQRGQEKAAHRNQVA